MKNHSKKQPNSIDDITSIITDKNWYNPDRSMSRKILFHIMYGIFRKGNNQWLEDSSRKWARDRNVVIDQSSLTTLKSSITTERTGKDFIY